MEEGAIIKNDLKKAPKTGDWGYLKPEVDPAKCIGCETCVRFCPDACIEMKKRAAEEKEVSQENFREKELAHVDLEFCKGCGVCAEVCPVKAISMKK